MRPLLSLIVAVWNQRAHNRLFLESLERHSPLSRELLVVDNGSTDGSAALEALEAGPLDVVSPPGWRRC